MEKEPKFVVCLQNDGYTASLERHKIYRVLPDEGEEPEGYYIRVVDESGEDYLFPKKWFAPVDLPEGIAEASLDGSS